MCQSGQFDHHWSKEFALSFPAQIFEGFLARGQAGLVINKLSCFQSDYTRRSSFGRSVYRQIGFSADRFLRRSVCPAPDPPRSPPGCFPTRALPASHEPPCHGTARGSVVTWPCRGPCRGCDPGMGVRGQSQGLVGPRARQGTLPARHRCNPLQIPMMRPTRCTWPISEGGIALFSAGWFGHPEEATQLGGCFPVLRQLPPARSLARASGFQTRHGCLFEPRL